MFKAWCHKLQSLTKLYAERSTLLTIFTTSKRADLPPIVSDLSVNRALIATLGVQDAGNAVTPETSTVADGSYAPLSRFIYMNVNNNDWDLVRDFITYGYSDEGMDHVSDVGYVALPATMNAEMVSRIG